MKKITHEKYLQALGLYTMAKNHARKADEFRDELERLLELAPYGHVSDAIYDGGTTRDFDAALMLEGMEVEKN